MILALLLTVASTIPHAEPLRDDVATIERNTFCIDENPASVQYIFRDEEGEIIAWIMEKDTLRQWHPPLLLVERWGNTWVVTAGRWTESLSNYDPAPGMSYPGLGRRPRKEAP